MDEAEDEALSGPVDDNVDGHVVGIEGDFLCIGPIEGRAGVAELATNGGEAREPNSSNAPMKGPAL